MFLFTQIVFIAKFDPQKAISAVHYDGEQQTYYVKRFQVETNTVGKKFSFISESQGSKLMVASYASSPKITLTTKSGRNPKETTEIDLAAFIDVKGWKAIGNKLTNEKVLSIDLLEEEPIEDKKQEKEEIEDKPEKVEAKKEEKEEKKEEEKKSKPTDKGTEDKNVDIGSTIDLDVKKKKDKDDQLGLF